MRKTLKLLTLTGVAYLIAWTTASAQFEGIPDGLPVTDDDYLGDNQFSSDLLGDFELDTSVKNRFIHTILGPLVWDWDEATEMVILHTEWWGDLYTHLPDVSEENKHASGLGFTWPLVKSEITGAIYEVNVKADFSDPESTPFYNHRKLNGEKIGKQRSIGVDLSSAENYYKSAETSVGQMQSILAVMVQLQRQYVDLVVSTSTGMGPIDQKFEQINAQFLEMHEIWVKFVFYYHRCALAPVWAEREGKSEADIKLAQAYVNQLPDLETTAQNVYRNGQEILYVNSVQIKNAKMHALNAILAEEAARRAAEEAARRAPQEPVNSGGGSTSGDSTSGGNGQSTTPVVVDGDAISWADVDIVGRPVGTGAESFNVSAQLNGVNPHKGTYYSPRLTWYFNIDQKGTENWQAYVRDNGSTTKGNIWVFVPQGEHGVSGTKGRWWASSIEGYNSLYTIFPAGNLNFEHTNILQGTPIAAPWQPQSGVTYGWMLSTLVNGFGYNGRERSNIILQAWP